MSNTSDGRYTQIDLFLYSVSRNAPQQCPFMWAYPGPDPTLDSLSPALTSPNYKRKLDRLIRYCRVDGRGQQTDRRTTLLSL